MKHILLLEDHPLVADVLIRFLEEAKYYVTHVGRVADALAMLARAKVDLLIADVILPDGTAFDVIDEAVRREIPYTLMTGNIDRMAQFAANGDFHLAKPFKLATLISEVRARIGPGNGDGRN
jgi:DNA-binding response OmpR family regulator